MKVRKIAARQSKLSKEKHWGIFTAGTKKIMWNICGVYRGKQ